MKTVIMAGGKGTRISQVADHIPKPMIRIQGKPVLEHEIECLRDQGFTDLILTVGHLGNVIMDYFGDGNRISPATGKEFGVQIEYFIEKEALGNAGALFRLKEKLAEDFLLINGDILFDVDINRFMKRHKENGGFVTLFTHPNTHPYDSGLIVADQKGAVTQWFTGEEKRPEYYRNRVNAGLHILSPKVLSNQIMTAKADLDRQILKPLVGTGKMFVYDSPEYVKDMGTPDRYEAVIQDFESGIVKFKNLKKKQRAIFLDRDGTINKYAGFLNDIKSFELLPGAADAVRKINSLGYLAIVVTNQPVIARGEVTYQELETIHNKMETLLGQEGAYLDAVYYCPHHPDKGYAGEIQELKIDCDCRKPKPGMLLTASKEFNIDLNQSWMVGDSENDMKAGLAAGCQVARITTQKDADGQYLTVDSLLEFVDKLSENQC